MDIRHLRYLKPWPQASVEHSASAVPASGGPPKHAPHVAPPSDAGSGDAGTMTYPPARGQADKARLSADAVRHPDDRAGPESASPPGHPGPARPHLDTSLSSRISAGISWQ
jgi:hypothetical protein